MAWTTPATAVAGSTALTAAFWNEQVRDNVTDLDTRVNDVGMVHIATVALTGSSVQIVGCFSSAYTNYVLTARCVSSADAFLNFRLVNGTTPSTTSYISRNIRDDTSLIRATSTTLAQLGGSNNGSMNWLVLSSPNIATPTFATGHCFSTSPTENFIGSFGFRHTASTAFDGCEFNMITGTFSGSASVYGLRD